jgi:biotin carboxyl carrier protein
MGVTTEQAALTSFVRYQPVVAIVSATPNYLQEVYAPLAGRIKTVEARFGAMVESGEVLLTLVRDPIPRVDLTLTGDVLKPVSENLHESMSNLRRATLSAEILRKELNRLKSFSNGEEELPLLPTKEIIKIEYDLLQAEREVSIVEDELARHGLSPEQIREIEGGEIPPVDAEIWLNALKHNGYWTPLAQDIYSALREPLKDSAWAVATIAELVAGDLVDESLLDWMAEDTCATQRFLEIGGLLQRGHDLAYGKELCTLGALESVVLIRAPQTATDWDVRDLRVKPGQYVEEREPLLVLENPRSLYLSAEPTQSEIGTVVQAMKSKSIMEAKPLIPGSGPSLTGLQIKKMYSDEKGITHAMLTLENAPLFGQEDNTGTVYRSWQLREGQRYELRVPLEVFEKVYVFPTEAVVEEGADRIIFLQSGDDFQKIKVEVKYQDHEVTVLPATSDIFPGNPIVTQGAFALSLALQSDSGDAGHGHDHAH